MEVKSFVGQSDVKDLEQALGQYIVYQQIIDANDENRLLYLAITQLTYNNVFSIEIGQILIKNKIIKLIVFDE